MTRDVDVEAAEEIYRHGKEDGERIKEEAERMMVEASEMVEDAKAFGAIQMIDYHDKHNKLLRYAMFYKVKQDKAYKKSGATWDQFCESLGETSRNVNRILDDMGPIYDEFSDKMSDLLGVKFNKLRYLGRSKSDNLSDFKDGELVVGDTKIPLKPENKDDIEALIDEMRASHKKAVQEKEDEIGALRKMNDTKRGELEKLNKKLAKIERTAEEKGFAPGEEEYLDAISKFRQTFDGFMLRIDPRNKAAVPEDATPRMMAAYLTTIDYMRRQIFLMHAGATEVYGEPELDGGWKQPDAGEGAGGADVVDIFQKR